MIFLGEKQGGALESEDYGEGGGEGTHVMYGRSEYRPSHPYNTGA